MSRLFLAVAAACRATRRAFSKRKPFLCEHFFRSLVEHSPNFIVRFDRACDVVYMNPAMRRMVRSTDPAQLATAMKVGTGAHPDFLDTLRLTLASGIEQQAEFHFDMGDEPSRWIAVRFIAERDAAGHVATVLAIGREVTEMVHYRERMHRLALFDTLTDLPNRALLWERLVDALAGADGNRQWIGLMLVNLDDFANVNNILGHACGDRLLCDVAARLARHAPRGSTLGRLGGDDFALIVALPHDAVVDLGCLASTILAALSVPTDMGREITVSASIGIARYPQDGTDASELLRHANAAMHAAKLLGGNRFCMHDSGEAKAAFDRMELGYALRTAREHRQLMLFFQPIVSLPDGKLLGMEALVRWRHPSRGILTPDSFISVAEGNDTINDIGEWVLTQACASVSRWNSTSSEELRVSVNMSPRQFVRDDMIQKVRDALAATACAPRWLTIEVTESLLLEDNLRVSRMLGELTQMGVVIALDDFGTGYSAMGYLGKFPIGMLKIDRAFVQDIDTDVKKLALVKAIMAIASAFSLDVVAEGIETSGQADMLAALGCPKGQGYLFGKPTPEASFDDAPGQGSCERNLGPA